MGSYAFKSFLSNELQRGPYHTTTTGWCLMTSTSTGWCLMTSTSLGWCLKTSTFLGWCLKTSASLGWCLKTSASLGWCLKTSTSLGQCLMPSLWLSLVQCGGGPDRDLPGPGQRPAADPPAGQRQHQRVPAAHPHPEELPGPDAGQALQPRPRRVTWSLLTENTSSSTVPLCAQH